MPSVENLLGLNLQKCSNMVRLRDRRHGGYMFVPCGHCTNCVTNYRNNLARRLDLEREGSASSLFFTLTYDNSHIPTFTPTYRDEDDTTHLLCRDSNGNLDIENSIVLDKHLVPSLNALCPVQNGKNSFISDTYSYCRKSDFQKFLKRLRRLIDYDSKNLLSSIPQEDRTLRYFLCTEYGPKTYRAHAHGILFFRNKVVANAVEHHYIFDAWKFCSRDNLRCAPLIDGGSSYVSKYVNKSADYPSILQLPFASTFYLSSRSPALGCSFLRNHDIPSMLEKRDFTITRPVKQSDESIRLVQLPLPKQVASYYFPRCFRFVYLDRRELLNIYGSKINISLNPHFSHFPSLINEVKRKYNLKTHGNHLNTSTYTNIYDCLSCSERQFGIPVNRLCAVRAYLYCSRYNLSIEQYIDDLLAFYSHSFSSGFSMFVDYLNDHDLNLKTLISCYHSSFLELPHDADLLVYNKFNSALECLLNDFNLTLLDLYDSNGKLLDLNSLSYDNSVEFKIYSEKVHNLNADFERQRLFAHMSNQIHNNYETF